MDRMGVQTILPVKVYVTIDTILIFSGDFDGHGDVTCKQTFIHIELEWNLFHDLENSPLWYHVGVFTL